MARVSARRSGQADSAHGIGWRVRESDPRWSSRQAVAWALSLLGGTRALLGARRVVLGGGVDEPDGRVHFTMPSLCCPLASVIDPTSSSTRRTSSRMLA